MASCGLLRTLLVLATLSSLATATWAQMDRDERLLIDALEALVASTSIDLAFSNTLIGETTTRCIVVTSDTPISQLRCLLNATPFKTVVMENGTIVIRRVDSTVLTGLVLDAKTGAPIPDVHVVLPERSLGSVTDKDGLFEVDAFVSIATKIRLSHVGYADSTIIVHLDEASATPVSISLHPVSLALWSLDVSDSESATVASGDKISRGELLSATASERMNVLAMNGRIGGVSLSPSTSDLHLQGGSAGEVTYRIDDARVFVPIQTGGFLGPFSTVALDEIVVHKAGFGVAEGSHLSGVVNARQFLPKAGKRRNLLQIDPTSVSALFSGRSDEVPGADISWMIAGRTSLWPVYSPNALKSRLNSWSSPDRFLQASGVFGTRASDQPFAIRDEKFDLNFSDIHSSVRADFGSGRSIHGSVYVGGTSLVSQQALQTGAETDIAFVGRETFRYRWSNLATNLGYDWTLSDRSLLQVGLAVSRYSLVHPYHQEISSRNAVGRLGAQSLDISYDDQNLITEINLESTLDHTIGRHFLTFGSEITTNQVSYAFTLPSRDSGTQSTPLRHHTAVRLSAFAQDRVELPLSAALTMGWRSTYSESTSKFYLEPRFSFEQDLTESTGLGLRYQLSGGIYRQFLHQYDIASYQLSSFLPRYRIWLPSTGSPSLARHLAFAISLDLLPNLSVKADVYQKEQPQLLSIDYQALAHSDGSMTPADIPLVRGQGRSKGLSVELNWLKPNTQVRATYHLSSSEQLTPGRFGDRFVASPWSAPHSARIQAAFDLTPEFSLAVGGVGAFGRSWAFRQAYYDYLEPDPSGPVFGGVDFSDPESDRLSPYLSLNLGLTYTKDFAGLRYMGKLDLHNVLDRWNEAEWGLRQDPNTGEHVIVSRRLDSFLPNFSVSVSW